MIWIIIAPGLEQKVRKTFVYNDILDYFQFQITNESVKNILEAFQSRNRNKTIKNADVIKTVNFLQKCLLVADTEEV